MSPPTGAENHGADTLPVRGNDQVEAPEGPLRRAPARGLKTLQATWERLKRKKKDKLPNPNRSFLKLVLYRSYRTFKEYRYSTVVLDQ